MAWTLPIFTQSLMGNCALGSYLWGDLEDHIPSLDERSGGSSCNSGFANHAKVRHSSTLLTGNSAAPYMSVAICCLYNLLPISNGSMEKNCFQICNIFPSFSVDLLCFPWKISTAKHSPVPLSHRTWAVSLTMGSLFNKPGDGCHPWNQSHQESENARLLGWYNLACAMYSRGCVYTMDFASLNFGSLVRAYAIKLNGKHLYQTTVTRCLQHLAPRTPGREKPNFKIIMVQLPSYRWGANIGGYQHIPLVIPVISSSPKVPYGRSESHIVAVSSGCSQKQHKQSCICGLTTTAF